MNNNLLYILAGLFITFKVNALETINPSGQNVDVRHFQVAGFKLGMEERRASLIAGRRGKIEVLVTKKSPLTNSNIGALVWGSLDSQGENTVIRFTDDVSTVPASRVLYKLDYVYNEPNVLLTSLLKKYGQPTLAYPKLGYYAWCMLDIIATGQCDMTKPYMIYDVTIVSGHGALTLADPTYDINFESHKY